MTKIKNIINLFQQVSPFSYQESYDNSGLIVGNPEQEITSILITLDTTEEIIEQAIKTGANLIISHHPIIFKALKTITGKNHIERIIIKAIKNNIAILAVHTNIDNVFQGVNSKLSEKLNLKNCKILSTKSNELKKLITFVPEKSANQVRKAIFDAGAGQIGDYNSCSYNTNGKGTFRATSGTNPFVGKINELHTESEVRIETIFPKHKKSQIIQALLKTHPYEEVAYDIYSLDNEHKKVGSGMLGELAEPISELKFLEKIKQSFNVHTIKHSPLLNKDIRTVAFCGGAGSFLLNKAIQQRADIFISAEFKYNQFFDVDKKILIADIGHFESEQYTKELFYEIITKKFTHIKVINSEINTNAVKYF